MTVSIYFFITFTPDRNVPVIISLMAVTILLALAFCLPFSILIAHVLYLFLFLQKFIDRSKLKRHEVIHTGRKDFICPHEGCGKVISFSW